MREKNANRSLVAGFPDIINRNDQCRLCGLVEDAPELLTWIHAQFKAGSGVRALETATRRRWTERGETPLDHRCFARHFESHVEPRASKVDVGSELVSAQIEETRREIKSVSDAVDREVFGDDNSDFFDMKNVIQRMKGWVQKFDDDNELRNEEGGLDTYRLMAAMKLSGELRASIEAFNRMKNSERVTRAILQGHTKRYTQHLSPQITTELVQIREALESGDVATAEDLVDVLLKARLGIIFRSSADTSVKESCEVYRLS